VGREDNLRVLKLSEERILSQIIWSIVQEISYIHGFSSCSGAQEPISMIVADYVHVETGLDTYIHLMWVVKITCACSSFPKNDSYLKLYEQQCSRNLAYSWIFIMDFTSCSVAQQKLSMILADYVHVETGLDTSLHLICVMKMTCACSNHPENFFFFF
jgi:hypothetical protein